MRYTMSALVENKPGVLSRVASLFRRRNFNIDSLTVGRTENENLSRMTIIIIGTEAEAIKVEKCLYKLPNVVRVEHLQDKPTVAIDLALVKVSLTMESISEVKQICGKCAARIVDISPASAIIEMTGDEEKIENFVDMIRPMGIIEMVRTGIVAMSRGIHRVAPDEDYQVTAARGGKNAF
ncbi:MAG: acetolactate synthase small subunit [Acidobacteriota bacterium]